MFKDFEFKENVSLSKYSTMKVGGNVRFMVFPKNRKELIAILEIVKNNHLKYFILGNGSNILFSDKGFDGVAINLKHFNFIKKKQNYICVGAGINMFVLNQKLKSFGLSGLEWSYGIPATLGGFLVMNSGSFGHEICEFVESVCVLDNGKVKILKKDKIEFSYRYSNLSQYIVLSAKLKLDFLNSIEIENKMFENFNKKRSSQPCELPSLGSIFKLIHSENETIYPAKIIDKLGLKGATIGKAEVSQKHAGFIVNMGGATSQDILKLIEKLEVEMAKVGVFPKREIIVMD